MLINLLLVIATASVAVWVVASIMIMHQLNKRNIPTNFLLARLFIPKYAGQYRDITRQETGRTGGLFYVWVVSINLALVAAIAVAILK